VPAARDPLIIASNTVCAVQYRHSCDEWEDYEKTGDMRYSHVSFIVLLHISRIDQKASDFVIIQAKVHMIGKPVTGGPATHMPEPG
jgi:hypothetical protein